MYTGGNVFTTLFVFLLPEPAAQPDSEGDRSESGQLLPTKSASVPLPLEPLVSLSDNSD